MLSVIVAPGRLSVTPAPIGRGALFGIDLLGEIHRALHVGEEDSDLLPLPFERAAGGEDLLGEMLRRVAPRIGGLRQ
jgi:hypothetical protein